MAGPRAPLDAAAGGGPASASRVDSAARLRHQPGPCGPPGTVPAMAPSAEMNMSRLFSWRVTTDSVVMPEERPPLSSALPMGVQHLIAMSGSTIVGPLLMGFDPNVAMLCSGIGTILFYLLTAGRVPSYLGSSFSFIAVVIAVTGYAGTGPNPDIPAALGGIIACGVLYMLIGAAVSATGTGWIERLMPPAVTAAIGAAIGLNLAPVAVKGTEGSGMHVTVALLTILAVAMVATYGPKALRRLSILIGIIAGYVLVLLFGNLAGLMPGVDFSHLAAAPWIGLPAFTAPRFSPQAVSLIAPVALVLVAENLGHIKAISAMTGRDMNPWIGRGFIGDGLATTLAGCVGGTGVTTYAENMGVMALTRVFSTFVFLVAAAIAILLGFSPKFGAFLQTIPGPVLGGLSVCVFGMIAAAMIRLWVENGVDFSSPRTLFTVGVALVFGSGDFSVTIGHFALGGIGTATLAALVLNQILGMGDARRP